MAQISTHNTLQLDSLLSIRRFVLIVDDNLFGALFNRTGAFALRISAASCKHPIGAFPSPQGRSALRALILRNLFDWSDLVNCFKLFFYYLRLFPKIIHMVYTAVRQAKSLRVAIIAIPAMFAILPPGSIYILNLLLLRRAQITSFKFFRFYSFRSVLLVPFFNNTIIYPSRQSCSRIRKRSS